MAQFNRSMIWPFHIHRACTPGLYCEMLHGSYPEVGSAFSAARPASFHWPLWIIPPFPVSFIPSSLPVSLIPFTLFHLSWQFLPCSLARNFIYLPIDRVIGYPSHAQLRPRLLSPTDFAVKKWRRITPVECFFIEVRAISYLQTAL